MICVASFPSHLFFSPQQMRFKLKQSTYSAAREDEDEGRGGGDARDKQAEVKQY